MTIPAGRKSRKVTIRATVRTPDEYGGFTETQSDVATAYARVRPLQGSQQLTAMQTGLSEPYEFTFSYRADLTEVSEIYYDGRRFDVTSVIDPEERHRELIVLADRVQT